MIKNSKILMIALPLTLMLLCYAAYEYGYTSLNSKITELQDTRERKEKMLFKYIAAISKKQQIAGTLHFLRPLKTVDDEGMINERVPAVAMENLRNKVRDIVTQGGGRIDGDKAAEPKKSGIYTIYEIEFDAMLPDSRALNEMVYAFESNTLYMVIRNLDVRVTNPEAPGELAAKFRIAAMGIGK